MLARTYSAIIQGLQPIKITVELDSTRGVPHFIIIGLPSRAVEESKERITAALSNCGIRIRSQRTIVNLAPADVHKNTPSFELAISVGLLKLYGEITTPTDKTLFLGELSLDGTVRPVRGVLPIIRAAASMGFTHAVVPEENISEVSLIKDVVIHPIQHLQQYLSLTKLARPLPVMKPISFTSINQSVSDVSLDDICGQHQAKRVLQIAAAGGHNVLLVGPPGAGKSLLAHSMSSILPPLTEQEALEITTIHSLVTDNNQLIVNRPFRSPHHTVSSVGLLGGGAHLLPGEISLAHRGILFLDEFTEFSRPTIEMLRQPLENRYITLTRAMGSVIYPSSFTLIAASNPCPCGWRGSLQHPCSCSDFHYQQYLKKISGPILDRIDLVIFVKPVPPKKLSSFISNPQSPTEKYSTKVLRERVIVARQMQQQLLKHSSCVTNGELSSKAVRTLFCFTSEAQNLLTQAAEQHKLTARSYHKIAKVAQTIALLDSHTTIETADIAEAIQYRPVHAISTVTNPTARQ